MSLDRYEAQARVIADELLELLTGAEQKTIERLLKADDHDPEWAKLQGQEFEMAVKLLTATPAKRRALWERIAKADRLNLWIRARILALQSARTLQLVLDVQDVEGLGYRDAVRHIAQSALRQPLWPRQDEIMDQVS